jgi:hypothetical protein
MFDLALGLGIPMINVILSAVYIDMCSLIMLKNGHHSVYSTKRSVLDL